MIQDKPQKCRYCNRTLPKTNKGFCSVYCQAFYVSKKAKEKMEKNK